MSKIVQYNELNLKYNALDWVPRLAERLAINPKVAD